MPPLSNGEGCQRWRKNSYAFLVNAPILSTAGLLQQSKTKTFPMEPVKEFRLPPNDVERNKKKTCWGGETSLASQWTRAACSGLSGQTWRDNERQQREGGEEAETQNCLWKESIVWEGKYLGAECFRPRVRGLWWTGTGPQCSVWLDRVWGQNST